MTVLLPRYLQTKEYSAKDLRQVAQSLVMREGIVDFGDFAVSQRGAGANMSVDVAAGEAFVQGDTLADQGFYHVRNDAVVNVAIPAAHATLPRLDQVVLRVYDSTVTGSTDLAVVEVVAGTATAGATLENRNGAAALPASALRLAEVLVAAADTSITTAEIGAPVNPGAVTLESASGAPAAYAHGRPLGYVPAFSGTVPANVAFGAAMPWTERHDNEGGHDPAVNTHRYTVKTPGLWLLLLDPPSAASARLSRTSIVTTGAPIGDIIGASAAADNTVPYLAELYATDTLDLFNASGSVAGGVGAAIQGVWQGPSPL